MTWLARLAWIYAMLASLGCVTLGVLIPGIYDGLGGSGTEGPVLFATIGFVGAVYATGGMLILRQRIRHLVGWLLLAAGIMVPTEFLVFAIGFRQTDLGDPLGPWLMVASAAFFWPTILLAGPVVALFFPDGRLPSRRWRLPAMVGGALIGLIILALILRPGSVDPERGFPDNPMGVSAIPPELLGMIESTGFLVVVGAVGIAIGSVFTRLRRATMEERVQLRWFVSAVVVWSVLLPVSLTSDSVVLAAAAIGALALVPTAIVIAITRYRLYEIDTLINRTLVYVPLVGIVAGLYAACLALLQRAFVAVTGNTSDAAAVISALILAAVFTPIRKSIEAFVDRRFKPAPADTDHAAASLAEDPAFMQAVDTVVRRILAEQPAARPAIGPDAVATQPADLNRAPVTGHRESVLEQP